MISMIDSIIGWNDNNKLEMEDKEYVIKYKAGNVTIYKESKRLFSCTIHGDALYRLIVDDYMYTYNDDMSLISIKYKDTLLYTNAYLDGIIDNVVYSRGNIIQATYNGDMYKRCDGDRPLYLVYTNDEIHGYMQGLHITFVEDKNKYMLVVDGHILGFTTILDTMASIHWIYDIDEVLKNIKHYNPYPFFNLLPQHYFDCKYWYVLKRNNINIPPCKNVILQSLYVKYYMSKSTLIIYNGNNVQCLYGKQNDIKIVNNNLHGILHLTYDYYYHHGILQWKRKYNRYIIMYSDDNVICMYIYKDRVIYNNRSYIFVDEIVFIPYLDMTIMFNQGIPIVNCCNTKINEIPDE